MPEGPVEKGYLKRLVAGAASAARTIHPVVGARLTAVRAGRDSFLDLMAEPLSLDAERSDWGAVDVSPSESPRPARGYGEPGRDFSPLLQPGAPLAPFFAEDVFSSAPPEPQRRTDASSMRSTPVPMRTETLGDPAAKASDRSIAAPSNEQTAAKPAGAKPEQPRQAEDAGHTPSDAEDDEEDGLRIAAVRTASALIPVSGSTSPVAGIGPEVQARAAESSDLPTRDTAPTLGRGRRAGETQPFEAFASSRVDSRPRPETRSEDEPQSEAQTGTEVHPQRWAPARSEGETRRESVLSVPAQQFASARPDEINIHIGRVEVTAVPPPAALPVSRPVRKTLSLDEYLSRTR